MRPEHDLLLSCVRTAFTNDRMDTPPALPEAVDWNRFIGLCEWHMSFPPCTGSFLSPFQVQSPRRP